METLIIANLEDIFYFFCNIILTIDLWMAQEQWTWAFLCQNTISKPFCSLFSTWLSCVKTWIKCLTLWFTWWIQLNTIYLNWKIAETKIKKITRKSLAKTVVFSKKCNFLKARIIIVNIFIDNLTMVEYYWIIVRSVLKVNSFDY